MKKQHLLAFVAAFAALAVRAQTFDVVNDFSTTTNTDTGRWSYRFKVGTVRDGNYLLLPGYGDALGSWSPTNPGAWTLGGGVPEVGVNQTGSDVTANATITWPNATMLVHPGNLDLVVVSWLSPSAALLTINFSFTSLDPGGGNGIAWFVEQNNSTNTLSSGSYPDGGTSGPQSLSGIAVNAGDRINFIVDPNGDYTSDSTMVTATISAVGAPQTYDVAADFSATSNPNGTWSYGYSQTLGGTLNPYVATDNVDGLDHWRTNISGSGTPMLFHNPTTNTLTSGSTQVAPGGFGLHPGPNGEYSVARLTVPWTGQYRLTGSFFGQDTVGTTTDVHILTNSVSLLDGDVTGFGPGTGPSFDFYLSLNSGDELDFAVGYGPDAGFFNDSTGLSAQIVALTPPVILAQPSSQTVAVGGNVAFNVGAAGTPPLSYQWLFNTTNLPGATNATLTLTNVAPWQSGFYAVLVTNTYGQAVSSNALLTVLLPQLQIRLSGEDVLLWWPTNASGFLLETSTWLGANPNWSAFPGPIIVVGDQNLATVDATSGPKFFRLRRP